MKNFRQLLLLLAYANFLFSCTNQNLKESAVTDNSTSNQRKKERIAELNESVFGISVVIEGKDAPRIYSVGTGFLIGENLLASALHVQSRAEELAKKFDRPYKVVGWQKIKPNDSVEFSIEIAAEDKENDLIIYKFDDKTFKNSPKFSVVKPLALAKSLPTVGEEVVSIGYYGNYQFPFNSLGNVAMIDGNEDIFSDLTLMPGNSGAPVCNLETREVVGVTTDVLDLGNETVRYGIAKSAAKLRAILAKL